MRNISTLLLFLLLFSCNKFTEPIENGNPEREALMALYNSTDGDSWTRNAGWGDYEVSVDWSGVDVNSNGNVYGLRLAGRNLNGTLPDRLADLKYLKNLELNDNKLTGDIPDAILDNPNFAQIVFNIIRQKEGYGFNLSNVEYYVPSFSYTDLDGNTVESESAFAANRLTVLFSWSPVNLASHQFIPNMYRLYEGLKAKKLGVIALSTDREADMRGYIDNIQPMPWTNICDSKNYFRDKLAITADAPQVVVVNSTGRVVFDTNRNRDDLEAFLTQELGKPDPMDYYTSTDYSEDGKYVTLQRATEGNGVNIVFTGDGFVDRDFAAGGKWETAMNTAMENFFSIEPSKSYREYFNVYAVKAVSKNDVYYPDSETVFGAKFSTDGSTRITGNDAKVGRYAEKIPGVSRRSTATAIIINSRQYAGTCYLYENTESYAYIPMPNIQGDPQREFQEILLHEYLGHGFSRLLDEYVYNPGTITAAAKSEFLNNRAQFGIGWNLSVDRGNVPWQHFIGLERFKMVGLYEGGYLYRYGVWRAEQNQCMNDNVAYFNAPSRELFVKQVMKLAGRDYSWDEFLAKDKYEPVTGSRAIEANRNFIPLPTPVLRSGSSE